MNENQSVPVPHPSRLNPERKDYSLILKAHQDACLAGNDTYRDPVTGYSVFTTFYHLKEGSCCNSGCRHCPFVKN
ncbi:MAG: hypothetical protein IPJ75_11575 [Ignavibacteriales bacterium]|nr:hypothetical protein [Ignavibacteriales bacterium]